MQVSADAILTYFITYGTLALLSASKKTHLFTYSPVALLCAATYKIHISNTINTIVELYINYCSKISYLFSLIFRKNWDVYKMCF